MLPYLFADRLAHIGAVLGLEFHCREPTSTTSRDWLRIRDVTSVNVSDSKQGVSSPTALH